jgi:4-amino-4-deoxy-L-arabinose transferase-like glycosyltransferase
LLVGGAGTFLFQDYAAHLYLRTTWWLPYATQLLLVGFLGLLLGWLLKLNYARIAGFSCVMAALLVTPGIWSGLTNQNANNQTLPSAYMGDSTSFGAFDGGGGETTLQVDQSLLTFLEQNTQGMRYMLAVDSSMQGAGYVIASGRGVLYMGGFSGQDQVVTITDLAALVASHQLRYIQLGDVGGFGGGSGSSAEISSWVKTNCQVVQNISGGNSFGRGFGDTGSVYDCASGG